MFRIFYTAFEKNSQLVDVKLSVYWFLSLVLDIINLMDLSSLFPNDFTKRN